MIKRFHNLTTKMQTVIYKGEMIEMTREEANAFKSADKNLADCVVESVNSKMSSLKSAEAGSLNSTQGSASVTDGVVDANASLKEPVADGVTILEELIAEDGHKLTQADEVELKDRLLASAVMLGKGCPASGWIEITDEEADEIQRQQDEERIAEEEARRREHERHMDPDYRPEPEPEPEPEVEIIEEVEEVGPDANLDVEIVETVDK